MSTINLLPRDYLRRRSTRRANMLMLGLFGVVMVGLITADYVSQRSYAQASEVLTRVNADFTDAAKLIDQMHQLEEQANALQNKAKVISALVERIPRSTLLGIAACALPRDTSMVKVDLYVQQVVNKAVSDSAKKAANPKSTAAVATKDKEKVPEPVMPKTSLMMDISGLAATDLEVGRFIANLARCQLVKLADLAYSQEKVIDGTPIREFQIKLEFKSNVDAMDMLRTTDSDQTSEISARTEDARGQT